MKAILTLTAASVIAFSGLATAEQSLSMNEMDGVSAGGFASAAAFADAFGVDTFANTNTVTDVRSVENVQGQFGSIYDIIASALAEAAAGSDGNALANAQGQGVTRGSLLSDTNSGAPEVEGDPAEVFAVTDTTVGLPFATSSAMNMSVASSILRGYTASSSSLANSAASLSNSVASPSN
jgi:hypothetical protein